MPESQDPNAIKAPTSGEQIDGLTVEFDGPQTARVTEIVQERLARQSTQHSREKADLQKQLDDLKKLQAAPPSSKAGDKSQAELDEIQRVNAARDAEVASLRAALVEKDKSIESAVAQSNAIRKSAAISNAASNVGFYDLGMVTAGLSDRIVWSEEHNTFVVLGPTGSAELNSQYKPKGLPEFFQDYAKQNPWTVKSQNLFGTGASEAARAGVSSDGKISYKDIFGPKADADKANHLALTDKPEYNRLKEEARKAGFIKH